MTATEQATSAPATDVALSRALSRLQVDAFDETGWTELYAALSGYVFALSFRFLRGDSALAEDVCQEVFLRLLRYGQFNEHREPGVFRAYVRTITLRVSSETARRIQARAEEAFPKDGDALSRLSEVASDSYGAYKSDYEIFGNQKFEEAFRSLSASDQQLLVFVVEGYRLGEVAKLINRSYAAVGTSLHRIRARFRDLLEDETSVR
jgi:RNA polymerase sigma factor (sigma-70 family)